MAHSPHALRDFRPRRRWRRRNDPASLRAMFFSGMRQAAAAVRIVMALVIGAYAGLILAGGS